MGDNLNEYRSLYVKREGKAKSFVTVEKELIHLEGCPLVN